MRAKVKRNYSEATRRKMAELARNRPEKDRLVFMEAAKAKASRPVSEETRKKMSESAKNKDPEIIKKFIHQAKNKTEETKRRMSESARIREREPWPEETRKKIGDRQRGKIISMDTRYRMSKARRGIKCFKHTEESKRKISDANKRNAINNPMEDRPLTPEEIKFCCEYVANGLNIAEAARWCGIDLVDVSAWGRRALKKSNVQKFIREYMEKLEEKFEITLEYKLKKLKKIIDLSVPEDASMHEQLASTHAIQAIAEHNRMSGSYAPTKTIDTSINVNPEAQEVKELMEEIIKGYERDA